MIADDELGDEVKVFRRDEDADDDPMCGGESSEQQLADDKKEAVMEAELDGRNPVINGLKDFIKAEPSPSFPLIPGFMPGAPFSPGYTALPMFMPLMMPGPYGLRSPNPMMLPMALSPSFGMFPTSPFFGPQAAAVAAAAAAKQHLENAAPMHMRGGPLNPLNRMHMPPYLPPGMMPQNGDRRGHGGGKVKKEDHIKKPLNAFMWFMKENRKKLLEEIGNNEKQSAELNKELGKRWHDLPKEEQQKYFEMAKKDRDTHKEKYPQWSARENYAVNKKKTKKRRDKSIASENSDQKKCRARFGVNNTEMWCKFCKRKKKCEYATDRSGSDMNDAHDGMGTSGACSSSSSESHSPTGSVATDQALVAAAVQQQQNQVALATAQFLQMQMQMRNPSTSLGPSPLTTSSAAHTPVEDANASDSESDVDDDDEEIDPTVMAQTQEVMIHDAVCTL